MRTERIDYTGEGIDPAQAPAAPYELIVAWVDEALARQSDLGDVPEPQALSVASVDAAGEPDVRTVLMRFLDPRGPGFVTSLISAKGRQLTAAPIAAAALTWPSMFRAIRFRGPVQRVEAEEITGYFQQRPWSSRISAWASRQSEPVADRQGLEAAYAQYAQRYPDRGDPADVPVPPDWGGFRILPREVEIWAGRRDRLHDRIRYWRTDGAAGGLDEAGVWSRERLQP